MLLLRPRPLPLRPPAPAASPPASAAAQPHCLAHPRPRAAPAVPAAPRKRGPVLVGGPRWPPSAGGPPGAPRPIPRGRRASLPLQRQDRSASQRGRLQAAVPASPRPLAVAGGQKAAGPVAASTGPHQRWCHRPRSPPACTWAASAGSRPAAVPVGRVAAGAARGAPRWAGPAATGVQTERAQAAASG